MAGFMRYQILFLQRYLSPQALDPRLTIQLTGNLNWKNVMDSVRADPEVFWSDDFENGGVGGWEGMLGEDDSDEDGEIDDDVGPDDEAFDSPEESEDSEDSEEYSEGSDDGEDESFSAGQDAAKEYLFNSPFALF
jgi:nucleosome binding factor SPN SPT16 subunit